MNIIKFLKRVFIKTSLKAAPLLIIKKSMNHEEVKEYKSMEEAISDLENDPNISADKIEKLRTSLKSLKNKDVITIKNGEIIE